MVEKPATPTDSWTDRPILGADEDELGRAPFAASLAEAVAGWQGQDSLVIGLYGSWGSGKTSVKNMVFEALAKKPNPPIVIDFSPCPTERFRKWLPLPRFARPRPPEPCRGPAVKTSSWVCSVRA